MMTSITRSDSILVRFFLAILLLATCSGRGRASGVDDRRGAAVYVTNWTSNSVSRFELTAGGFLKLLEVVPAPAGSANALGAALSRDKRSLYVAQWGSGSLSLFQVKRDGSLVAAANVSAAPPSPTDSAQVVISPDGRRAYLTNFNADGAGTLSIYDLSRTPRAIATIPTGGEGAAGVAISVDGRTLYVAHMTSGDVTAFRIRTDGSLTRLDLGSPAEVHLSSPCRQIAGDCGRRMRFRTILRGSEFCQAVGFRPTDLPLRSTVTDRGES